MPKRLLRQIQAEAYSFKSHIALHGPGKVMLYQLVIAIGGVMAAFGYSMFMVPFNLAAGGIGGLGVIINHFTGWPPGVLFLLMNLPLLVLGFVYLERWRFLFTCLLSIA
ncbi:MAG TPA: YitT family protein, partial [Desulfuromonadales bacterium]|nr:YitT family protein [Desulfuromonadales bacterium]